MNSGESEPAKAHNGSLFISEFVDRELVEFNKCSKHYETFKPGQLCEEMAFLMRPELRAIPFGFSGRRYYALAQALIFSAAKSRDVTHLYRGRMMNLCMDLLEYNYQRTAPESRDALLTAVKASLEYVHTYALYPEVADIIAMGQRDHYAPLKESAAGAFLETER